MLPEDWGRTLERPRAYKLPDALGDLLGRYEHGGRSTQLRDIADRALLRGATAVFVEAPYVDFDYRAEFSNLYARSFVPPPDRCERLLFFADREFLGFSVMRPMHKTVGRTAIAPPPDLERFACCLATHRVRPYGTGIAVEAFPFMSQDGQYGRCAHAAIWAIARYHHLVHRTAKHSIAAVVDAAGTRESVDRTTSSEGLYLHEVAVALRGLGLPAKPASSTRRATRISARWPSRRPSTALSTPNTRARWATSPSSIAPSSPTCPTSAHGGSTPQPTTGR